MLRNKYPNLLISVIAMLFLIFSVPQMSVSGVNPDDLSSVVKTTIENHYGGNFDVEATDNGIVEIEGKVNSLFDKYRIFDIVAKINGVKGIKNQIFVETQNLPDEQIEDLVRDRLQIVASIIEPNRINVEVKDGVVFLSGKVSFYREKIMANTAISWQKGVKGIVDRLEVIPMEEVKSDENLKIIAENILSNSFTTQKNNVNVEVNNGVITLTGKVSSLWDKRNIEEEIADVLGVKEVKNELNVSEDIL